MYALPVATEVAKLREQITCSDRDSFMLLLYIPRRAQHDRRTGRSRRVADNSGVLSHQRINVDYLPVLLQAIVTKFIRECNNNLVTAWCPARQPGSQAKIVNLTTHGTALPTRCILIHQSIRGTRVSIARVSKSMQSLYLCSTELLRRSGTKAT
jgi:hypothetical protein